MKRRWPLVIALAFVAGCLGVYGWWSNRKEHRYDRWILAAAQRYEVDAALVKAVVWKESDFEAAARGGAGEFGLMQIQELSALEWVQAERVHNFDAVHLLDPRTNTLAGTWYLRRLLRRFQSLSDPRPYALAAYNAGLGNALRWSQGSAATNQADFIAGITFPATRRYVESVLRRAEHYRGEFPEVRVAGR